MIDVLLTAAVIAAVGFAAFHVGRKIGYDEALAELQSRRRYAGQ